MENNVFKSNIKGNSKKLTSSRSVGMRDIKALLTAPISRIKTLRDDEGRKDKKNVGHVLSDNKIDCHAERSLLSISTALTSQGRDSEQKRLRMTPNLNVGPALPDNQIKRHSRMSLSGIPTAFNNAQGGDPRTLRAAASGMTTHSKEEALNRNPFRVPLRSGFTLIELLVVILIIGILAAIALPQYQLAVKKTHVTAALARLKMLTKAVDHYELINGLDESCSNTITFIGPDTNASLDVNIPFVACKGVSRGDGEPVVSCDTYNFSYNAYVSCGLVRVQALDMNHWDFWFEFRKVPLTTSYQDAWADKTSPEQVNKGQWVGYCAYRSSNSMDKRLCQWLEGQGFYSLAE